MEKLKKEFILNASVMSILIAILLARIGAAIDLSNSELSNRDDWFIPFIIFFLVLYAFNLVISIINYVIGQMVRNFAFRLLIFNVLGLLVVIVAWFFFKEIIILVIFSTFIVFSVVAVVINYPSKGKSHK